MGDVIPFPGRTVEPFLPQGLVAANLGLSKRSIQRYVAQGVVESRIIGGHSCVRVSEVERARAMKREAS